MPNNVKSTPLRLLREIISSDSYQLYNYVRGANIIIQSDSTILNLIQSGCSFVRWGDGETAIARGKFAFYQQFENSLSKKLFELISNPPDNVIFGLPWVVNVGFFDKKWNVRIFKILFSTRIFLIKHLNYNSENISNKFSTLDFWWRHSQNLKQTLNTVLGDSECILIASDKQYMNFCPEKTTFIQVPALNAFSHYEEIKAKIESQIKLGSERKVLLCAAGPTSKVILLDFYSKCQVLDIGHGFNFALRGMNSWYWAKN